MIKLQLDSFCPISGTALSFLHLPLTIMACDGVELLNAKHYLSHK